MTKSSQSTSASKGGASRTTRRRGVPVLAVIAALAIAGGLVIASQTKHARPAPATPTGQASGQAMPALGQVAPAGVFTTPSGARVDLSTLRGHPALVWFVATWCSSCQAGTQTVAENLGKLRAHGVEVVELELYEDLGGPGQPIGPFGRRFGGAAAGGPHWRLGEASKATTLVYDPGAYLDVYYLLGPRGHVRYINGSPTSTMAALLAQVTRLYPAAG